MNLYYVHTEWESEQVLVAADSEAEAIAIVTHPLRGAEAELLPPLIPAWADVEITCSSPTTEVRDSPDTLLYHAGEGDLTLGEWRGLEAYRARQGVLPLEDKP